MMNEMRIAAIEADKRTAAQMEALRVLVMQQAPPDAQRTFNTYQASAQPYRQAAQQYPPHDRPPRCLYCDAMDHAKRDCRELNRDIQDRKCMIQEGHVCLPDGRKVMLATGRGGMMAEVRRQQTGGQGPDRPVPATGPNAVPVADRTPGRTDASSRRISVETVTTDDDRAEAAIQAATGWNDPVFRDSCQAYVASYHDADANAFRRKRDEEGPTAEPAVAKRTRLRGREEESPRIMEIDDNADVLEAENATRPPKRTPAFKLASELQRETDLNGLVRDRILEAPVTLPLKSLLGLDGTKMQDLFMSLMKRKRIVPEGDRDVNVTAVAAASARDGAGHVLGDTESEYDVNCFSARSRLESPESEDDDYRRGYWSRATPAISIRFTGVDEAIPALIDHGSEVNVMSWEVFGLANPSFPMETNLAWNMKTANGGISKMLGACTDVPVSVGSITVGHNFFVQTDVSFPVILGQPWIHKMRLSTTVLDDGMHYGLIRSLDGETTLQVQIVRKYHERHKTELRARCAARQSRDFGDRQA
jgi:hypothetical protein